MKSFLSVGAVVAALAPICVLTADYESGRGEVSPAPVLRRAGNVCSNVPVIPLTLTNWTNWAWAPGGCPEFKVQPLRTPIRPCPPIAPLGIPPGLQGLVFTNQAFLPGALAMVPPGVYETAPYSCIVVVPGPHPDDECVRRPRGGHYSMPIVKPDLRFIPRRQEEK